MNIDKAMTYFITSLESEQLSVHTIRAYRQDLNQFIIWAQKETLDELSFEDFEKYFLEISALKVTSIKRKRVVLHRFLKYCYRKKICTERLYEYIDPIRTKKSTAPKEVLTKQEIASIFEYLDAEVDKYSVETDNVYHNYLYYCAIRNRLIINFLLYTGCRAQEVVSVKKSNIHFEKNEIILLTKGNKYNTIPIHEILIAAFIQYEEDLKKTIPDVKENILKSPYLFPSKGDINECLSSRTLHDFMKRLSEITQRHIHAHIFRHTFASYCIAANMDISTISSLISHSNPSITLSIYTHEIDSHNKQQQIKKLTFE